MRATLAPLCDELTVDGRPSLLRLANVQHLATAISGTAGPGRAGRATIRCCALVAALHPTGAVCGTPTEVAMELIRELEGMDRGRYAGPVGWVDARGNGEWGIALRCAEVDGPRARLFAGCGIVGRLGPRGRAGRDPGQVPRPCSSRSKPDAAAASAWPGFGGPAGRGRAGRPQPAAQRRPGRPAGAHLHHPDPGPGSRSP